VIEVQGWVAPRRAFTRGLARWRRARSTPVAASIGGQLAFILGAPEVVEPFLANVAGLPPTRAGKIFAGGRRVTGPRSDILFLSREAPLVGKTVREHLQSVCAWRGESAGFVRAEEVLAEHDLTPLLDRSVASLSLTERKRARFAEMIALEAPVSIVLAPFVGLGPEDTHLAKRALSRPQTLAHPKASASPTPERIVIVYEVSGGAAHMLAAEARSASVVMLTASPELGSALTVSPFTRTPQHHVVRVMTAESKRLATALEAAPGIVEVKTFDAMVVAWGEERAAIAHAIAQVSQEQGIALGAIQ